MLHGTFHGGFHHNHMCEGNFATMKVVVKPGQTAATVQSNCYVTNSLTRPAAAATTDPSLRQLTTKNAGKDLKPLQSKAQCAGFATQLAETADTLAAHHAGALAGGKVPAAAPAGDARANALTKVQGQATKKRSAASQTSQEGFVSTGPTITGKKRVLAKPGNAELKDTPCGQVGKWTVWSCSEVEGLPWPCTCVRFGFVQ